MTLREIENKVRELSQSAIELDEQLAQLKNSGCCSCQQQPPLELEIEWPEADIKGLHFNRQWTKGVFELKEGGWYHSRDILFMSARNIEDDNSRDTLLEYLESVTVNEAFYQALNEAGVIKEGDMNIEISLPKENEGVKKYNGVDWRYWLLPPQSGSAAYFCYVNNYGDAYHSGASGVTGCAPAFCAGV